ncbi:MAG TPA: SIR2 family protein [Blastocatellia bacterium]|nr:SIR2 family protein [Blastocatellia bacterium]
MELIRFNATGAEAVSTWSRTLEGVGDEPDEYEIPYYHLCAGALSGKFCEQSAAMENTVITFNYDTVLEDSLCDIGAPFHYGFPDGSVNYRQSARCDEAQEGLAVLKLHGSVNWGLTQARHPPYRSAGVMTNFGLGKFRCS